MIFSKKFIFGSSNQVEGYINVTNETMYSSELGHGFVTEKTKEIDELLRIPEIGSAFNIAQELTGQDVTSILMEDRGGEDNLRRSFCYSDKKDIPLSFRVKVPHNGNYNVKVIMGDKNEDTVVTLFSERRRCVLKNAAAKAGQFIEHTFTANVCDIIPRGKNEVYNDDGLDITIIGNKSCINALIVEEAINTPTIYIAGDSTVTDQSAQSPYNPAKSYCGWAQMFPLFLKQGISVSNHAHSGLTTESFKSEGHWSIVENSIKPGDIFFIQFGHNDQKIKSLDAYGGYADNLRVYVDEVRAKGAFSVIVTPVSRTIWNGPDGAFNDLLKDYADACIKVAEEKKVPLIDLHKKSIDFILKYGAVDSTKFFYPKDWTHHNDFGAYEMAKLVVQAIREVRLETVTDYLRDVLEETVNLEEIAQLIGPTSDIEMDQKEWAKSNQWVQQLTVPKLSDIENHHGKADIESMIRLGILKIEGEKFFPDSIITKVEFLDMLLKTVKYPPVNVYNDMYSDVLGHEWYAGIIQAAYDNEIIDAAITASGVIKPEADITYDELLSMVINAYKSRKNIHIDVPVENKNFESIDISDWAVKYHLYAENLGINEDINGIKLGGKDSVTRAQAVIILKRLLNKL